MSSTRDRLEKEYATDEIVVEWEPRLCYHSRNCVRSLPQVFDESRRPWVTVDAATADEVEADEGNVLFEGERAALCRCGGSSNKPFCDGTHEKIGFRG